MRKVHSNLQRLKQLSTRSIAGVQWGSMGFNAWNTFFKGRTLKVQCQKVRKIFDMGELTFHAKKTACCQLQQETKIDV